MSVRVNLVPREVEERNVARRQMLAAGGAGIVLLLALGGAYAWQASKVDAAEEQLAERHGEIQALEADLATLQEFEELETRSDAAEDLLQAALGGEVTMAGILQDLAAVFPAEAELSGLGVSLMLDETAEPELGVTRTVVGKLTAQGRTANGVAPGVERLLLELGKVAAFDNVFLTSSQQETENVEATQFTVEVDLGSEVRTGRYLDGLPEELR